MTAAAVLPVWLIFLVAGGVCPLMAVVAVIVARMPRDELTHPLDRDTGLDHDPGRYRDHVKLHRRKRLLAHEKAFADEIR